MWLVCFPRQLSFHYNSLSLRSWGCCVWHFNLWIMISTLPPFNTHNFGIRWAFEADNN